MAVSGIIEASEVARRLSQELPCWRFEGSALKRLYKVNGFRSALLAANAIGHIAEAAWHHPDLAISWGRVEVSLWSHDAGGVTERDMALARRIEDVIAWRPPQGSPLEGTPADAQYAYLLPD
jgi:4a-hydroxytetrahydrobiopterin dehydratase